MAMMNSSKSMTWLRSNQTANAQHPPLQDKTNQFTNSQSVTAHQTQKNSTQNIHSILKIEDSGSAIQSHEKKALGGARHQSAGQQLPPSHFMAKFQCCKGGQMLMSSQETANCSLCGLFYIFNVSCLVTKSKQKNASVIRSLRESAKEFTLDFPIAKIIQNMKVKSQETLQMLNPHAIYLNVTVILM